MSNIQINNLQAAGSDFFQSSESFLTELQAIEAHAIYGGKKGSNKGSNKGFNNGSNNSSGRNSFVPFPMPFHCPPCRC
jgi:hypothetical protein